MLSIAICDDDIQTTGQIEMMIQKIAKRNFADVDIEVFWNGESLADSVVAGGWIRYHLSRHRDEQRGWDFNS